MTKVSSRPEARRCSARRACLASCRNSPWIGTKYRGRTRFRTSFISSMLACPETCTGGFMLPYNTSAPRRAMWSIMRKMPFSLPGMMRELNTTVSPSSTEMCLWLSTATGESADRGSPCVAELRRKIQHQLNSVDGRTETRDHQTSLGAVEDVFHARLDGALGFGVARPVGIGRVGKEEEDAPLTVVGQGVQVEELVVGGGGIDLEIAGVDDDSQRRGDGQRDGAHDGVRDMDKLDLEWTYRQYLLRLDRIQLGFFFKLVFFQPPLYQSQREGCSVHWHADLGQEIGHRSDVVLMAVGQDQSFDLRLVLLQEGEIGHDQVHAQQFVFREHHPGVDHDDFVAETDGGHVHAELAQSAQGDYL